MSPLRYQKWLRLNEVRRPMLNEHYDVTTAAYAVGYESYPISVGNIRGCLESHPREILPGFPIKREPTFITNALSLETRRLANVLATLIDCLM